MRRTILLLVLGTATGCGTVANWASGDPQVFGGIQKDLLWTEQLMSGAAQTSINPSNGLNNPYAAAIVLACFAAEPPLSFAGDTLTLPLVLLLRRPSPSEPDHPTKSVSTGFSTANASPDN